MVATLTGLRTAKSFRDFTKAEAFGRIARKGLDSRIIKRSMEFELAGDDDKPVNLVLNDLVWVDEFDIVMVFQKLNHFYSAES